MRKQTKIAAIVSAAALLAIGASMSAFAATGWQEEDGTWVYYSKNGERVTDSWEKSGDNWFYLDESGTMATDSLIEDDDNYYYVDANGAMVRNQWVAIDNEDAGEEDQPDVWWYYFQANGKAYKNTHSSSNIFKKVINGKTYCFDDDGKMQYGWVSHGDGTTNYDDNAYEECEYYFGDENDGAMSTGWREIALTDVDSAEEDQPGDSFWDEDQVRWFWFKSSGKKQTAKDNKTINGRKYGFDEHGRIIADWHVATESNVLRNYSRRGTSSDANDTIPKDTYKYAREFQYFSTPEDGARYTKGWFKVVPGYFLNASDYDDSSDRWFYADGNGKLYAGQIKSIKGKKYAFDLKGGMISGLAVLRVDSGNNILEYVDDEDAYDTEDNFDQYVKDQIVGQPIDVNRGNYAVYYFSNDEDHDGAMKTGTQRVVLDGDTLNFKFKKSGTQKGQGITGLDEKKYYLGGKLMAADSDNKIEIIKITRDHIGSSPEISITGLEKMTVAEFIKEMHFDSKSVEDKTIGKASKGDTVYGYSSTDKWDNLGIRNDVPAQTGTGYVVVNTSGAVMKSGSKKDGEGFKVVVKDGKINQIIVED